MSECEDWAEFEEVIRTKIMENDEASRILSFSTIFWQLNRSSDQRSKTAQFVWTLPKSSQFSPKTARKITISAYFEFETFFTIKESSQQTTIIHQCVTRLPYFSPNKRPQILSYFITILFRFHFSRWYPHLNFVLKWYGFLITHFTHTHKPNHTFYILHRVM